MLPYSAINTTICQIPTVSPPAGSWREIKILSNDNGLHKFNPTFAGKLCKRMTL